MARGSRAWAWLTHLPAMPLEWEGRRGATLTEQPWLSAFLAALPAAGEEILDIGCGSGVPVATADRAGVTGVDGAATLIDRARSAFPDHRWIVEDVRTLSLTDKFQGLIGWHSFFDLPAEDQPGMFGRCGRLAAPGAALMFTSGTTMYSARKEG